MDGTDAEPGELQPKPLSPAWWWYGNKQVQWETYVAIQKRYKPHFRDPADARAAADEAISRVLSARSSTLEHAPTDFDRSSVEGKTAFDNTLTKALCRFAASGLMLRAVCAAIYSEITGVKNKQGVIVYGQSTTATDVGSCPSDDEDDDTNVRPIAAPGFETNTMPTNTGAHDANPTINRTTIVQLIQDPSGVAENHTSAASEQKTPEDVLM